MVVIVALVKLADGKGKEYEEEFRKIAPKVRKDPGAITHILQRDTKNPNQFFWYEKYENDEALK